MVDYTAARTKMVDGQVRPNDVTDHRIIAAMLDVPRELFVPAARRPLAYIDRDIPVVGDGLGRAARALIQPMIFSRLVQAAAIDPSDVVLEVGTATGYGSAVLARLASSVVALEEDAELASLATQTLQDQGCDNVAVVTGPLVAGYAAEGPYDVIVLSGGVDEVPAALFDQLKDGGRLVAVVGRGQAGRAMLYTRTGGDVAGRIIMNASVTALPGFARPVEFTF